MVPFESIKASMGDHMEIVDDASDELKTQLRPCSPMIGPFAKDWSDTTHGALLDLDIPEAHHRETYLAAFLSCWICVFSLPLKNQGHIRPGVFKPASYLASGREISLAIPVLASIYRGMGELCISSSPGKHPGSFPAHFVYAWIASYFPSHRSTAHVSVGGCMINFHGHEVALSFDGSEARSLIRSNKSIAWLSTFVNRSKDEDFINDNI
ncbi:hypothetical protein BVRB_8g188030 [Beta vulgaris subsp. vulgaris]|nr:hypothetical protein BVRB_8g188030 [Beta vulgaris subsp. vulgaris]